jgi:hypothetical protein
MVRYRWPKTTGGRYSAWLGEEWRGRGRRRRRRRRRERRSGRVGVEG